MDADEPARILEIISLHGGRGAVWARLPRFPDEDVFVLTPGGAAKLREGPAAEALTRLLKRKVWLVTDPPASGPRELLGQVPDRG
jgi:hypothetical protein